MVRMYMSNRNLVRRVAGWCMNCGVKISLYKFYGI